MDTFLKKIPLFADLPPSDLERLCALVTEIELSAGETLFTEGDPGDRAYVIKSGQLEILKTSGGSSVLLAVRHSGEVIGEMSLLEAAPRFATARARSDCTLVVIEQQHFDHLLDTSPSAARMVLHTVTARLRSTEVILRQSEKMAQLGTLTAGIAHELNNPAAAVARGADQLQEAAVRWQAALSELHRCAPAQAQQAHIRALSGQVQAAARRPADLDALGRSDREEEAEDWLAARGVAEGWQFAPLLVNLGIIPAALDELTRAFPGEAFAVLMGWLEASYSLQSLLEEIAQGSRQMSAIIGALRSYVYLDQAPVQAVDLHAGLDATLVLLRGRLKGGITVRRDYDPDLPRITAYGSELNQVWTNLIANAADALGEQGEITLRTRRAGSSVTVEVQDNGPGIPLEVQPRLFTPFFTTKPVGQGTGLGLNISYNIVKKHGGEIKAASQPGLTCFTVTLPVNFDAAEPQAAPLEGVEMPSDEELFAILSTSRHLAVVGISDRPDAPSRNIPAFMQAAGYKILPVNPHLSEVLGEKAYPSLAAIPIPIDIVVVYRRAEFVPEIVEQAAAAGAKVVWMQEGIIHEGAALAAKQAGLKVVMDSCIGKTYERLFLGVK